ncbi:MAG: hypothetical protein ACTSP1_12745 [Candidatus Freyarchaeota archaeon]|nr:CooT family nickel-binding protein [Candidatus Freyarchaeota archaeon]MDO8089773.1 CooT family nickel-binding protein [Candidatus Sigynarchaeota archaeon]
MKVYLDKGSERELIASEITLIVQENNRVKLSDIQFREITLDNVEISRISALDSELILKPLS